ncbi:Elmo domain-containing protein b, partial [Globisporangium splendens]
MTASAVVRRAARENEGFVRRVWRWVKNTIWQMFFGQSEVQRICTPMGNQVDEQSRIVRFRTSLALSNALVKICNAVFDFEAFPEMLEQLWSNLKPNVRRSGGRITKEWGEIGFQGNMRTAFDLHSNRTHALTMLLFHDFLATLGTDPMSDFRGMGIFSLYQLLHFTGKYPVEAQAFVIELVNERLVDFKLYKFANLQNATLDSSNENDGLEELHELYSTIFTRFNKLWVDSNPRDVMAFPTIFNALKKTIRKELVKRSFLTSNQSSAFASNACQKDAKAEELKQKTKAARQAGKMGGRTTGKKNLHSKKKGYKRSHATKNRARDIDQIQDDLKLEQLKGKPMEFEKDEDLPGLGQFYCTPCARHFIDAVTRDVHLKTKVHKRRMKDVAQKQYTQKEAELGAGKTVEKYTPAHPKESDMDDL